MCCGTQFTGTKCLILYKVYTMCFPCLCLPKYRARIGIINTTGSFRMCCGTQTQFMGTKCSIQYNVYTMCFPCLCLPNYRVRIDINTVRSHRMCCGTQFTGTKCLIQYMVYTMCFPVLCLNTELGLILTLKDP